jgi:translation initiation factor 5A
MSFKNLPGNSLKKGNYFMDGNEPCMVLDIEHSKAGKHGHAKNRVTAVGLFDKKKRSIILTSGSNVQVPEINKRTAQITDIKDSGITVMDIESFETFDCDWPEDDEVAMSKLKDLQTKPDIMSKSSVEYWEIVGKKVIRRVVTQE